MRPAQRRAGRNHPIKKTMKFILPLFVTLSFVVSAFTFVLFFAGADLPVNLLIGCVIASGASVLIWEADKL